MKKDIILGTLLCSSALIMTSQHEVEASTSAIKSESKKITITSQSAKLFKDSKLKSYSTTKQGTVYQVDGYRMINGKHYYRLYQTNSKGDKTYKGYLNSSYAKTLTLTKSSKKYIAKKDATLWNNLYYSQKKAVLNEEKSYFTKGYYKLGNGKVYYSIYQKDSKNKDKWCGYTYSGNLKELKATSYNKTVTLTRNYNSWNNLYFTQKKNSYDYTKGLNYKAKLYYTIGGKKFYSLYRIDSQGKEYWCGYMNGVALKELTSKSIPTDQQKMVIKSNSYTYKDHYFHAIDFLQSGTHVIAKRSYTYGNGKTYYSIYKKSNDTWLGYINSNSLEKAVILDNYNKAIIKYNTFQELYKKLEAKKDYFDSDDIRKIEQLYISLKPSNNNISLNMNFTAQNKLNQSIIEFNNKVEKAIDSINQLMILTKYINELNTLISDAKQTMKSNIYTEESIDNLKNTTKKANDFLNQNSHPTFKNIDEFIQINDNLNNALHKLTVNDECKPILNDIDNIIKKWNENQDIIKTLFDDNKINSLTKLINEKNNYINSNQSLISYKQSLNNQLNSLSNEHISKDKWNYSESNDYIKLISYKGSELNIHIPNTFNNKKIIINTNGAPISNNKKIESIIMDNVNLEGNLSNCFSGYTHLSSIKLNKVNSNKVTNMSYMFAKLNNSCHISGLNNLDTSNVTNMSHMFENYEQLSNLSDLKNWNTSNVTDMENMFYSCTGLNDISGLQNWNTSNVTNMENMFYRCNKLNNLSSLQNWDISNVTNMEDMFYSCDGLNNLSGLQNWDTSNVTNMSYLFNSCYGLNDISGLQNWDTSNVTNMSHMFKDCRNLSNLSGLQNWNISNVTSMAGMFINCEQLNDISSLSNWRNDKHIVYINDMFYGTSVSQYDIDQFTNNFNYEEH